MHTICNAGERVDGRIGHTVLICKGSSKGRRIAIEKNGWNKKVSVKFQKSAWVETTVAEEIATDFVQNKKDEHGDALVVLALHNLSAHVAESVKKIFQMEIFR